MTVLGEDLGEAHLVEPHYLEDLQPWGKLIPVAFGTLGGLEGGQRPLRGLLSEATASAPSARRRISSPSFCPSSSGSLCELLARA